MTIRYEGQTTPLHVASLYGHITFVKHLILDQNHDPGVCDENGLTPLHCASLNGHLDIVKFIGEFTDHDPQAITKIFHDHYQNTPLHYACKGGHVDVVKYLVHKKICSLNDRNIEGLTPLHLSCNSRHMDVLEYLTDELEFDLNVTDKYGATLLHYASQFGHVHVIDYLVNKCKFNPEVKNGNDGNTPLHIACQCGHVHAAEFLIRMQSCNPELVNFDSRTPLHLACECGKLDVVEYLTEIGCSVCVMDCDLRTPIYYSFRNDHMNIISFFINKIQDKYDSSIIVEISNNACEFGRIDLMRQLKALNFNACHQLFKDNRTALHIVCQHGHLDVAKYLMKESGCNPAAQDIYGQTPLHYAFQYNHIDIVHHFINHSDLSVAIKSQALDPLEAIAASINKTPCNNKGKGDLLLLACKAGHLGFVKLLLNFDLYQDQCNLERDKMLLHLACKYGHIDIISYLLDLEEYDKENRDDYNRTPLHFACEGGYLDVVKYLIKEKKCNMYVKDNGNKMPVHYAVKNGYFDIFLYLIEEGTDLGKSDANSVPLLHYAAILDQKYIASYLIIECSFSSEAKDKDKKTPLHYASLFGRKTMVQYLIVEQNCSPDAKDKDLWTPLHFACQGGHLEIVNYLIMEQGCDPQCMAKDHETPFHIASQFDHVKIIDYLSHFENFNPNVRNANEMTPLHIASIHGNMQCIQYLIDELGCDPNIMDAEDQTPLHHACKNGFSMVANYLISEKGCNPEVKDKYGRTPLLCALQSNHLETVKYLASLLSVGNYCNEIDTYLDVELLFYFCKHGYVTLLDSITSNIMEWMNCREKKDRTPLHYACIYGHIDIVKYIVLHVRGNCASMIEGTDMYQVTPLNYACLYGHRDIIEYLVPMAIGTDPFLTLYFDKFNTLEELNLFQDFLFLACKIGHLGFVQLIVEGHKWSPDIYDQDQVTPLHYACTSGHTNIVHFLFSEHPHLQYDDKEDVLFCACKEGQLDLVISIIEVQKFNPEVRDHEQRTPFYYACLNRHISIAQYLADQPICSVYYKQEALVIACQAGLLHIMKSLINNFCKWDPEAKDENGHTLLCHACINGHLNITLYLIGEHHCELMAEDDDHFSPLDHALQHGHKHIVEHFMDLGSIVHYKDVKVVDIIKRSRFKWLTPLHVACQAGCLAAVKYFIDEKAYDPEVRDHNERTPLHYACHADIVQYLMDEKNCDPCAIDIDCLTPLDFICCNPDSNYEQVGDIVRVLSRKTSQCHANEKKGNTPLHLACKYNNYIVADTLLSEGISDPTFKNYAGQTPIKLTSSYEIFGAFIQSQSAATEVAYHELFFVMQEEDALQIMQKLTNNKKWDPNTKTKKGEGALHFACRLCKQRVILYLLHEANCNPNVKNASGITPFLCSPDWIVSRPSYIRLFSSHGATDSYIRAIANLDEGEALEFAKHLTTQGIWNLNEMDNTGETVLHSACRANRPRIVLYLLSKGNCNPNVQNRAGMTPIYYVLNPDIIGHLIKHGAKLSDVYLHITSQNEDIAMNIIEHLSYYTTSWNPNRKTSSDEIMLHFAMKQEQVQIISYLFPLAISDDAIEEDLLIDACKYLSQHNPDWNPNLTTSNGYNILHLACMSNKLTVVKYLLSEMCCDPNTVSEPGDIPLRCTSNPEIVIQLLRHGANLPTVYQTHGKVLGTKEPLKPPVKIFIVGDPSVGKSTLTAALRKELPLLARTFTNKRVYDVDEKTAGVVPHEFQSRKFGRVILYDFAGQREFYSSHAALLQNAVKHSSPVFLIVVNLIKADKDIKQTISYWTSFIGNQCMLVTRKPHIIIVGSHADVLKAEGQNANQKGHTIDSFCTISLNPNLEYIGFVAMDCQYFESAGMSDLRQYLKRSCEALRISENISFNAHCFQVYLQHRFPDTAAVQIKIVLAGISDNEQDTHSDISSFIPSSLHYLLNICKELNERGHIIFLENSKDAKYSWIILNKIALLSDVTGTIFAPKGFRQHCQLASSTGVVPLQKLNENFPNHSTDMLVGFLSHLEFCHEIIDHEVLKLIEKHQMESSETSSPNERYFFFPGLVRLKREDMIWKKSKVYVSGWIMQCSEQDNFFTSRFLQVLFLRLAFNFAMVQSQEAIDHQVPSIQRRCSVWKSGIYWGTRHGIEALVEVLSDSTAIVFLIQGNNLTEKIKLRSQVLRKIRDCVNELYKNVKISEGFIDPSIVSNIPALVKPNCILYTTEIATAIILNESDSVVSSNGIPLSLQEFLAFEPYLELGKPLLQHLYSEHSQQRLKRITNEFVGALSNQIKRSDNVSIFLKIFDNNLSDISQAIDSWRNQTEGTYICLKERLDIFSIFTGRNIFKLAGQLVPDTEATSVSLSIEQVTQPLYLDMCSKPQLQLLYELNTHKGKRLKVIKSVAFKWEQLAIALGFDGASIEKIKRDKFHQSKDATAEMFQEWLNDDNDLQGPITWGTLIQCLVDAELAEIAISLNLAITGNQELTMSDGYNGFILPFLGEKPTLKELQLLKGLDGRKVRIIDEVATEWEKLADTLGFEATEISYIQKDHHQQPVASCRQVLDTWLQENPDNQLQQPVTWETLIQCLIETGCSILVQDLQTILR